MPRYLLQMDVEAEADDPELLDALMGEVLTDFFATLHYDGELDAFSTLKVLQSPIRELTDDEIRERMMREDRLRRLHKIIEHRLPYRAEPKPKQLELFDP